MGTVALVVVVLFQDNFLIYILSFKLCICVWGAGVLGGQSWSDGDCEMPDYGCWDLNSALWQEEHHL